ncbi:hypothetical protein NUW54_g11863 [Trametes sanguinea]|uniref:Uncharacterized protein n=1 Tax=Trametes sanguinea TaxID=158606 RepID=A0ACC1N6B8_9APHY|nr:hypothetical protein NUW54_g11863 [Trametes sanguinea]
MYSLTASYNAFKLASSQKSSGTSRTLLTRLTSRRSEIEALRRLSEEERHSYADPDAAADQMARLRVSQHTQHRLSDGSTYEDDVDSGGQTQNGDPYYSNGNSYGYDSPGSSSMHGLPPSSAGHQRLGSTASSYRRPSDAVPPRSHSPQVLSQSFSRTHSPAPSRDGLGRSRSPLEIDPYEANTHSRSSLSSSHDPSPVSMRSSQAGSVHTAATSTSGRSRSTSNAAYTPPISATNPNAAFVKIKIFDRVQDDLVRVLLPPQPARGRAVPHLERDAARLREDRAPELRVRVVAEVLALVDEPRAARVEHQPERVPGLRELVAQLAVARSEGAFASQQVEWQPAKSL